MIEYFLIQTLRTTAKRTLLAAACICTAIIFTVGCSRGEEASSTSESRDAVKDQVAATKSPETNGKPAKKDSAECFAVDTGEKDILESRTFAIDFEPFKGSCFVTAHDAGRTDPPIGSVIAIYRDGKRIYEFNSRYNPNAAGCWVEDVSFQDLTEDGLTDVIVMGMCGAKSGDIRGNEVFVNTGKGFKTDVAANDRLERFQTVEEVVDFVRQNQQLFKQ